jgi:hypothetical protein
METANEMKNMYVSMPVPTYCKFGYIFHLIRWRMPHARAGKGA